jgi:hypothetical protein
VSQAYESEADNEYVIRGNSAIMKCEVPSFVADFVSVDLWTDSDGNNYYPSNEYGNSPCTCPNVLSISAQTPLMTSKFQQLIIKLQYRLF